MHPPKLNGSNQSSTLAAQSQAVLPHLSRAQRQELLAYLLLSALILLFAMGAVVVYEYAIPQPHWVKLGNVEQFRPKQPMRVIVDRANVWVVNSGQDWLVLHSVPNDLTKCPVYWEEAYQRFSDPCRGSRYTIRGIFAMQGPAPTRSLDRYPVQIDANGDLSIEIPKPILGPPWQYLKEACIAQGLWPAWYIEKYWGQQQFCNYDLIGLELVDAR